MANAILVLNAGSSSLKFSVLVAAGDLTPVLRGQLEGLPTEPRFVARDIAGRIVGQRSWPAGTKLEPEEAIAFLFDWGRQEALAEHAIVAVGHRVVHGGVKFTRPIRVDADVLRELETLIPLAPLHQPHNLAVIHAIARRAPHVPQVACFDTAFHRTQPAVADAFALPRRYAEMGIRRYGFHGLSYEYIASVLPGIDANAANGRTVVAHLGNGASMCALKSCRAVATTMGFTALDGLVMGTRSGALDPGVLLFLMNQCGMNASDLENLLYHQSGLLGVSEISSDMRTLLASNDSRAGEAIDLFVYRIGRELGSLAAALGGLDAIVFTGGIGERAVAIRSRVCRDAAWLGLELDEAANQAGGQRINSPKSHIAAWVIPTDEELMIARHSRQVLEQDEK